MIESIVLMTDERTRKSFEAMSAEDAGNILKGLLRHAAGEEIDTSKWSDLALAVYPLIEGQVDRMTDLREKRSASGRSGGESKAEANRSKAEANCSKPVANCSKPVANEQQNVAPVPVPIPERETTLTGSKEKARFTPPTAEEVERYAAEKGLAIDAQRFVDFYTSKGWRVGSSPMKDWRAACRNWCARNAKDPPQKKSAPVFNFTQRQTDYDAMLMEVGL